MGAGPTGVELAGAIAELAHRTLARDFRRIDPRSARVVLVEAGPRVLPAFSETMSDYARRSLERLGVEVRVAAPVSACDAGGVTLGQGANAERLPAATVIWAAGVAASPVGAWLGVETDRQGRVGVAGDLSVAGSNNVFVIGDVARVLDADGRPVPGTAPACVVALGDCAHLFSDRPAEPLHRVVSLALGIPDLRQGRAAHHRSPVTRGRLP